MDEEIIENIISHIFRQAKMPEGVKPKVKKRVFSPVEISDDDLSYVTAAGETAETRTEAQAKKPPV